MRRTPLYLMLLMTLALVGGLNALSNTGGHALAQPEVTADVTGTPEIAFQIVGEIGRAVPRKFVYDPVFEQMAIVDAYNRLLLVNALDYQTKAVLHERGQYADIQFSHDGRWLAVLYNLTVELWDTQTLELAASLTELGGIREMLPPVTFSADDQLLVFFGSYPTPRALRLTETDRTPYPWVWHLPAARGEADSTLPRGLVAIQMFDYPNGFALAPNGRTVAALPSRLRVLNSYTLETEYEIPTARYEQDILTLYTSLYDDRLYFRSSGALVQVDTGTGVTAEFPLFTTFDEEHPEPPLDLSSLSPARAQVIGQDRTRVVNPLHARILGQSYRESHAYADHALTVTLIDMVQPPVGTQDNVYLLVRIEDSTANTVTYRLTSAGAQQMTLSPDKSELMLRVSDDDQVIRYNVSSGNIIHSFYPALRLNRFIRAQKNRVLAYDATGDVVISDFQRIAKNTRSVIAEDLRYSRQFDRFFFAPDNQSVVTLAGTEWRQWSVATGEVIRRERVTAQGGIVAASDDGFRFLFQGARSNGRTFNEVVDYGLNVNYRVEYEDIPGHSIERVVANPSWTRFLVVYTVNQYGPYAPANQIAAYDFEDGFLWLIAGDDLPSIDGRDYRWVDDETVAVIAPSLRGAGPERVYGIDYAPNNLPQCLMDAFPDSAERIWRRWERMVWLLRGDRLNQFTELLCQNIPPAVDTLVLTLVPSPTPAFITATPLPDTDPVICLAAAFPNDVDNYAALWTELSDGLDASQQRELTRLLCEGVLRGGGGGSQGTGDRQFVMLIDAVTGVRAAGNYVPPVVEQRPLGPIYDLFEQTERRSLGTVLLSKNQELLAASSLPGELVIYRLLRPYQQIVAGVTATAAAQFAAANQIYAQATPSPTYDIIGTARPTLTPTPSLTLFPRTTDRLFAEYRSEDVCPADRLYSIAAPPPSYDATGRILAPLQGDFLWAVEVENGTRYEDQDYPPCGLGLNCNLSPDSSWILARTFDEIFIMRPDASDSRLLWDLRTPNPPTPVPRDLRWSSGSVLEWTGRVPFVDANGRPFTREGTLRDVLNVFPDPAPFFGIQPVNDIPTTLVSRQPGGPYAVGYTTYSTGIGEGYKYYLIHTESGEARLFAESQYNQIDIQWHPYGDRLFYAFYHERSDSRVWYQLSMTEGNTAGMTEGNTAGMSDARNVELGTEIRPAGTWSPDGTQLALYTTYDDYPVAVWDNQSGVASFYCIPEDGDRGYGGSYTWSPDSRYIALRMPLPKDENVAGVGQHLLILNVETGEIVDLTTGMLEPFVWALDDGGYGSGDRITPTPSPTPLPTATP